MEMYELPPKQNAKENSFWKYVLPFKNWACFVKSDKLTQIFQKNSLVSENFLTFRGDRRKTPKVFWRGRLSDTLLKNTQNTEILSEISWKESKISEDL